MKTRWLLYLAPLALAPAAIASACAAGESVNTSAGTTASGAGGSGGGATTTTTTTGNTGGGGGGDLFDAGMGDGGEPSDCSEAAKLVYLLSHEGALYSFYPPTLEFKPIGPLVCPASQGATPWSMAVDRDGVAWALYDDGNIFHVDTATAACKPTGFVPNQQGIKIFGMGFVADAPGSSEETLYVAPAIGTGIGKIDTKTLTLTKIGYYDKITESAELTGTGDAKLYAYFTTSPPVVAEIDPKTSQVLSQAPQPSIDIGKGWAFAFWGGDFYLFSAPGVASRVDRYRPSDGTTVNLKSNIGFTVVGAGVSTCAPTVPPK